jgi:hypothetical protein
MRRFAWPCIGAQLVILDALLKLRQVCCDPRLLPKPMRKAAESVKLDQRRIFVFSQFTSITIAKLFENSLAELHTRHPELEDTFRRIDAERFTAVVYRTGKTET